MSHQVDLGIPAWHTLDELKTFLEDRIEGLRKQHEDLNDQISEIDLYLDVLTNLIEAAKEDGFQPDRKE